VVVSHRVDATVRQADGVPVATPLHLLDGRPWQDGSWVDPLSLLGCYTSFVVDGAGEVVDLPGHLERLRRDSALLLGREVDVEVVRRRAAEHVALVGGPVRLRVAVLARTPPLQPQDVRALHVATSSRPVPPEPDRAWSVQTVQHVRTLPAVKSVDPFVQLHLKREARLAGHDDALLRSGDALLEGTTWGLVALTATAAVAPQDGVLPSTGVARVLRAAGLPVERRALQREELAGVRLLVASNAVVVATAVARVDEQDISVDLDLLAVVRQRSRAERGVRLTG
jgi:branched-subunit amino acid aminotransferase/4-amino-4-deoxychorismate lyase